MVCALCYASEICAYMIGVSNLFDNYVLCTSSWVPCDVQIDNCVYFACLSNFVLLIMRYVLCARCHVICKNENVCIVFVLAAFPNMC